ncbi:MAG: 3-isopropylmalate dehydratase small subunit [Anaerolineae bacterium]
MQINGNVWKFGKNIDTDAIIPARYCNTADPDKLAPHCLEDADPDFVNKMSPGDIVVAAENFGCGSSREVAPITIKAAGVSAVVAKSFARIFFRNSINIGLPIFEHPQAADEIAEGDQISINPAAGLLTNHTQNKTYRLQPFPEFLQDIINLGGLRYWVEQKLAAQK